MEKIFYAWILIAACVASFSGLKKADYVWDDRRALGLLQDAQPQPDAAPNNGLREAWHLRADEPFTPMTKTVWTLVQTLTPGQELVPTVLHSLNLGLHAANSILVMLILAFVLQSSGAAFVGALLFALHPLQVEPVAYIAAAPYVLGAFFALFALWQYLVYGEQSSSDTRRSKGRSLHFATLSFVLALLTAPAMAVLPFLAFLLIGILPKRSSLAVARMPLWPLVLWALLAIFPAFWAIKADATAALAGQTPIWHRPFIAGDALMFYIAKLIAPVMLGPDYGRSPAFVMSHWWGYLSWLLPLLTLIFIGAARGLLQKILLTAFALFVVALAPYLGLVLFSEQATSTVANSYAYLALIGPALAVAAAVALGRRAWVPAVCGVAIACFAYFSYRNVEHWQNDKQLWEHAMQVNPQSPIVHATLADTYRREGNWEKARYHYEQVLTVNQIDPEVYYYLGEIELKHGSANKAVELFEKALALKPQYTAAYNRLGLAYFDQGDMDKALSYLQKATTLDPENSSNHRYLGMLHVRRQQYADAVPELEKSLKLASAAARPSDLAQTHALLGLSLSHTGAAAEAQKHLEAAVRLDPNEGTAHRTLGDIYFGQGLYSKARPHYEFAVKANGRDPELNRNLGTVLAEAKEYEAAATYFNKALELRPDWPEVLTSLGNAYFHLKRLNEASTALRRSLALKPNQADPHQVLGDIARWQGRNTESTGEYYLALKFNPEHAEANYRIGNWFLKNERRAEAIHHFKIALRSAPSDSRIQLQLRKAERGEGGGQASANATM